MTRAFVVVAMIIASTAVTDADSRTWRGFCATRVRAGGIDDRTNTKDQRVLISQIVDIEEREHWVAQARIEGAFARALTKTRPADEFHRFQPNQISACWLELTNRDDDPTLVAKWQDLINNAPAHDVITIDFSSNADATTSAKPSAPPAPAKPLSPPAEKEPAKLDPPKVSPRKAALQKEFGKRVAEYCRLHNITCDPPTPKKPEPTAPPVEKDEKQAPIRFVLSGDIKPDDKNNLQCFSNVMTIRHPGRWESFDEGTYVLQRYTVAFSNACAAAGHPLTSIVNVTVDDRGNREQVDSFVKDALNFHYPRVQLTP